MNLGSPDGVRQSQLALFRRSRRPLNISGNRAFDGTRTSLRPTACFLEMTVVIVLYADVGARFLIPFLVFFLIRAYDGFGA